MYEAIPEEFSKYTLIKFIGDEHKVGGPISKILKKSHAFLEFDILKYKNDISSFTLSK